MLRPKPAWNPEWASGFYRVPSANTPLSAVLRRRPVTSNLTELPAADLFSPNAPAVEIPAQPSGKSVFVNLDFHKDFTARSITYQVRPRGKATTSATNVPAPPGDTFVGTGYRVLPDLGSLEVSDDGIHYTTVCALKPIYRAHSQWKQKTIAFPPATGRYFRLNLQIGRAHV